MVTVHYSKDNTAGNRGDFEDRDPVNNEGGN